MSDPVHGHGHVVPRLDGAVARCGGPAICAKCALEKAALERDKTILKLQMKLKEAEDTIHGGVGTAGQRRRIEMAQRIEALECKLEIAKEALIAISKATASADKIHCIHQINGCVERAKATLDKL